MLLRILVAGLFGVTMSLANVSIFSIKGIILVILFFLYANLNYVQERDDS